MTLDDRSPCFSGNRPVTDESRLVTATILLVNASMRKHRIPVSGPTGRALRRAATDRRDDRIRCYESRDSRGEPGRLVGDCWRGAGGMHTLMIGQKGKNTRVTARPSGWSHAHDANNGMTRRQDHGLQPVRPVCPDGGTQVKWHVDRKSAEHH